MATWLGLSFLGLALVGWATHALMTPEDEYAEPEDTDI